MNFINKILPSFTVGGPVNNNLLQTDHINLYFTEGDNIRRVEGTNETPIRSIQTITQTATNIPSTAGKIQFRYHFIEYIEISFSNMMKDLALLLE